MSIVSHCFLVILQFGTAGPDDFPLKIVSQDDSILYIYVYNKIILCLTTVWRLENPETTTTILLVLLLFLKSLNQ